MSVTSLPPRVVTRALRDIEHGAPGSVAQLWRLVYPWVRERAHVLLRAESLRRELGDAEDLAHEAFLKLKPSHLACCRDRKHLIRVATRAMRQALVDRARRRRRAGVAASLDDVPPPSARVATAADESLDIAMALDALQAVNPRLAEVATLHLLGGLSFVEVGRLLDRSEAWARMIWVQAEGWFSARFGG